jgi:hypothetical protein
MKVEDVAKSLDFKPPVAEIPNYNVVKSAVWAKIKLTCKQEDQWYLQFYPATFREVICYQKTGNGPWTIQKDGASIHSENKTLPVNQILFRVPVHPNDTTLVLIRVCDYFPITLDISAGSLKSFVSPFHLWDLFYGLCFGILFMMLVYNLYLFIVQKERVYLYYVLHVFFSSIFASYLL